MTGDNQIPAAGETRFVEANARRPDERRAAPPAAGARVAVSVEPDGVTTPPISGAPDAALVRSLAEGGRWYVASALANREFRAAEQLEAQRFRVFLPYVRKTVRHARRTLEVKRAAFPGYLFVGFDANRDRWRSINGTIGVSRLIVSGDGAPTPVPHGVVEALVSYLDETGACRFDRDLVVGQTVRVVAGPLADAVGRLVRLDGRGRVRVLLQILGGQVYATLQRSALEAA